MRYSTIFFDLYGTLFDIHTDEDADAAWAALADALAEAGGEVGSLDELRRTFAQVAAPEFAVGGGDPLFEPDYQKVYERLVRVTTGAAADDIGTIRATEAGHETVGGGAAVAGAMTLTGREISEAAANAAWAFRRASELRLRPYDGAHDLLEKLRRAGLRVVLVSNAQLPYTMPELEQFDLADEFDDIVISSDFGRKKPDPAIFRHAMVLAGVDDPSSVLMVGNDEHADIDGARGAGIDGAFLDTFGHGPYDGAVASFAGADYRGLLEFILK
ncbi:HAD family hydrolase [Bifidobacterium choloepi]|nr:HAD family hydrolase [Bifidobacterium choloepi]